MRHVRTWVLSIGLVLVLAALALFALYVPDEAQARIVALATAATAVASACAAIAAYRAARDSSASARETARAASYAGKPVMHCTIERRGDPPNEEARVIVQNLSVMRVHSGSVKWSLRDGTTGEASFGAIDANAIPHGNVWQVGNWGKHVAFTIKRLPDSLRGIDTLVTTYRGELGPVAWERTDYISFGGAPLIPFTEREVSP